MPSLRVLVFTFFILGFLAGWLVGEATFKEPLIVGVLGLILIILPLLLLLFILLIS